MGREEIDPPLIEIFESVLIASEVPGIWRIASVDLLFKGNRDIPGNDRLASLQETTIKSV